MNHSPGRLFFEPEELFRPSSVTMVDDNLMSIFKSFRETMPVSRPAKFLLPMASESCSKAAEQRPQVDRSDFAQENLPLLFYQKLFLCHDYNNIKVGKSNRSVDGRENPCRCQSGVELSPAQGCRERTVPGFLDWLKKSINQNRRAVSVAPTHAAPTSSSTN